MKDGSGHYRKFLNRIHTIIERLAKEGKIAGKQLKWSR